MRTPQPVTANRAAHREDAGRWEERTPAEWVQHAHREENPAASRAAPSDERREKAGAVPRATRAGGPFERRGKKLEKKFEVCKTLNSTLNLLMARDPAVCDTPVDRLAL